MNRKRRAGIRAGGAVMVATTMLVASIIAPAAASAAEVDLKFDFGGPTSPVAEGWTGLPAGTAYSAATGYGFVSGGATFRDRTGDGDPMLRDFVNGAWEFVVDLPSATYEVTTWSGDLTAGNTTDLTVEGVTYSSRTVAGAVDERLTLVEVTDGRLNVVGGRDGRINGIVVRTPVPVPASLSAEVSAGATPSVELNWDAVAEASGYEVYRSTETSELALVAEVDTARYVDTEVTVGEPYGYAVVAKDGDRRSERSATLDVTVVDSDVEVPPAPGGLEATSTAERSVTLAWGADSAAQQWKVYRTTREDIPFSLVATTSEPTWTDTDVLTTRPYLYRVTAGNGGGYSTASETLATDVTTTLVRDAEYLDRAPVAVALDAGVYVGWRLLGLDDRDLGFNVYRNGKKLNSAPLTGATNFVDEKGKSDSTYRITAVIDGREQQVTEEFGVWGDQYLDIPLQKPADGVTPAGEAYSYHPGDASVGDLDGDGTYEVVLLWNPSNSKDNSQAGYTGNAYMDAYRLDGTRLWRMDLGVNIRAGAHYTQFQVFDLDSDGRAEVAFKTADGTIDGQGAVIGDGAADHRNSTGYVLEGPEFLTVFDGLTGAALDTVDFTPPRGDVAAWGDTYGNRVDRFLAGVGYFDGQHPSLMFSRGYYTRSVLVAWDFRDGELTERWKFDSDEWGEEYEEQGNHNLTITDVDRDGLDEVVYGAMTIDDDGTPLYNSRLFHGDTLNVGDFVLDRPGLEIYSTFENQSKNGNIKAAMRDAETGAIIWQSDGDSDTGRGAIADIDPNHPGAEAWHPASRDIQTIIGPVKTAAGEVISEVTPDATFTAYWDGDPLRELVAHEYDATLRAGVPLVSKWDPSTSTQSVLYRADGLLTNGTQAQPLLQADLFGDWREELLLRHADGTALRLITTVDTTDTRIPTLMHDSQYRKAVAWENTAYNQPPRPSYFIGQDMQEPPAASIRYVNEPEPDAERPQVSLVTPSTKGPFSKLDLQVEATDDRDLQRIVANIYQGATLVKSTQTAVSGTSGVHQATVDLPDGDYTLKYNAHDAAGNVSQTKTFAFSIDTTVPKVTVKEGAAFTAGSGGVYDRVSFKLYDAGKIDRVEINGTVKDLANNTWSDVNHIEPGVFGAVLGQNTLIVYDVAGNARTETFELK